MDIRVKEINPYSANQWRDQFKNIKLYQDIISDYDHVVYSWRESTVLKAALHDTVYVTDRYIGELYRILDAVPYYYLYHTMVNNPEIIVDLGCGTNPFKKTWPNIIGIDSHYNPGTIANDAVVTHFDKDFAAEHQGMCDALISINAIHFDSIYTIKDRLQWVAQLVRPGGRAFVSFNVETWLMHTAKEEIRAIFGQWPKFDDIINYIYDQVLATKFDFVVSDWPVVRIPDSGTIRNSHNGNVRLVFNC
jgi:hypothetical protein